jgi:hypothetical protein
MVDTNAAVETIRRISLIPGDVLRNSEATNIINKIPDGFYYLLGDSTNAIDSRQLGLFSYGEVRGKVVMIIRSQ